MTLIKWTPKREMLNFFDNVDKMVGNTFLQTLETDNQTRSYIPFMNVNETGSDYTVSLDLPGIEKKDVEVNMRDGIVTVIGERKNSYHDKNHSCIWQETENGTFHRSFELSNAVQEDKIKARFKNGVLTLTIPKAPEIKPAVKKIAVS